MKYSDLLVKCGEICMDNPTYNSSVLKKMIRIVRNQRYVICMIFLTQPHRKNAVGF